MLPLEIYENILIYLNPEQLHQFAESLQWARYIVNCINRNTYIAKHTLHILKINNTHTLSQ